MWEKYIYRGTEIKTVMLFSASKYFSLSIIYFNYAFLWCSFFLRVLQYLSFLMISSQSFLPVSMENISKAIASLLGRYLEWYSCLNFFQFIAIIAIIYGPIRKLFPLLISGSIFLQQLISFKSDIEVSDHLLWRISSKLKHYLLEKNLIVFSK